MKALTLDRILQSQGYGTRKWCQQLIMQDAVRVDGVVVNDPRRAFQPAGPQFSVFDETFHYRAKVYLALNKPPGYECSRKASHHPGILSLLPEQMSWRDVQPVGRLDHDTTGLLLLSDDGDFIHRQASPRHHVPKRYRAQTQDAVSETLVEHLRAGVQLHDEPVPIAAESCVVTGSHEIELVLTEGKYHQVKRMLAAAGNHCAALTRIAIGQLTLGELALAEGAWCFLEAPELARLSSAPTESTTDAI